MLRAEPGVLDAHDPVVVHAGDRAGQPAAVGQVDGDVERLGVAGAEPGRLGDQVLDVAGQRRHDAVAERARRELAAQPLGADRLLAADAGQPGPQQPVADAPVREALDLDRDRVVGLLTLVDGGQPEPLSQETADRVLEEPHQVVELDRRLVTGGQRALEERTARDPAAPAAPRRRSGPPGRS